MLLGKPGAFLMKQASGVIMPGTDNDLSRPRRHFIDYLLYALAGGVLLSFAYSFVLWLRY
jgi:hypothetical protein